MPGGWRLPHLTTAPGSLLLRCKRQAVWAHWRPPVASRASRCAEAVASTSTHPALAPATLRCSLQGEGIEEAVRRETREEAGVDVVAVDIVGSQPWPVGEGTAAPAAGPAPSTLIPRKGAEAMPGVSASGVCNCAWTRLGLVTACGCCLQGAADPASS